jgi:hypothetical protein
LGYVVVRLLRLPEHDTSNGAEAASLDLRHSRVSSIQKMRVGSARQITSWTGVAGSLCPHEPASRAADAIKCRFAFVQQATFATGVNLLSQMMADPHQ